MMIWETGNCDMPEAKVLIVDDEEAIREMISVALELAGFQWLEAENATVAHSRIVDDRPDLILLDWMLPGTSGIELARRLKRDEATSEIPVIMLTAKSEEDNKIQGLDAGADDYITKPFSTRELISRINAVLRRAKGDRTKAILVDGLALDPVSHRITANDKPVEVGPTEYRRQEFFIIHQDRAYSRAQELDQLWIGNVYVKYSPVDEHIHRQRQ